MIYSDIQNQLQLLIKTSAPPLIAVADHAMAAPQWTPGQQIPAHVLASLPNGRFQVQVGDQTLDLNLPHNTQAGENLNLTFVSQTPRLTFALLRDVPMPATASANAPVELSSTAKFISNLQQGQLPAQLPGAASSRVSMPAVLSAAPVETPAFAQALRASVTQSGLFYESHQVEWINGERSLASLLQEPQGQLAPLLQTNSPPSNAQATAGHDNVSLAAHDVPVNSPQLAAGAAAADGGVHPQTVSLVQQQLQALDTRQVTWQGEVWPGQFMQWTIDEDQDHHDPSRQSADTAPTWHTRLNLQLPNLGGISAKLAFVNGAVQLDIAADDASSVTMLRQHQADLATRFASSGLQLSGVTIAHG